MIIQQPHIWSQISQAAGSHDHTHMAPYGLFRQRGQEWQQDAGDQIEPWQNREGTPMTRPALGTNAEHRSRQPGCFLGWTKPIDGSFWLIIFILDAWFSTPICYLRGQFYWISGHLPVLLCPLGGHLLQQCPESQIPQLVVHKDYWQ